MNGELTFSVVSTAHSEYHGVIFKCFKHNKNFTLEGKKLFETLKVGQIVELEYREKYRVNKEDGRRELIEVWTININLTTERNSNEKRWFLLVFRRDV